MSKAEVSQIIETIGADRICEVIGVGQHSVRYAKTEGLFAASWYAPMKALCDEAGISCPLHLFNWKTAQAAQPVEPATVQPEGDAA